MLWGQTCQLSDRWSLALFLKFQTLVFCVLGEHQRLRAPSALCTEYVSAAFYCKTMRGKLLQFSLAPMTFVTSSDCIVWF